VAPPQQLPPVVCKDNANCGVSTGQTGGITAGQIINLEPVAWYEWNGSSHKRQGNIFTATGGLEMGAFGQMSGLERNNDWQGLKEAAEAAITKYPEWPMPLAELSLADYHLCDKGGALSNAKTFASKATISSQFTNSYDQPLKISQGNLAAMQSGNWPSNCQ
jgi:hypothetical protein